MKYVLGIDQGGSKTHAIVMDKDGVVRGFGKSKGACHSAGPLDVALDYIEEAVDEALKESGLGRKQIDHIGAGLTGIDWDYEADMLKEALGERLQNKNISVVNDCIIAMRADTSGDVTGVICVGSGTNCAVRNKDELFIYGFYIPDEYQGGMCLGKKTVQAVFDAEIGLEDSTKLRQGVLEFFGVSNVEELLYLRSTNQIDEKMYLELPILLEEVAVHGDKVAVKIWEDYGKQLARFVTARIKLMKIQDKPIEIILSGSIFKCKVPQFIECVKKEILKCAPEAKVSSAVYEPIVGAALLALDQLYCEPLPEYVYQNLEQSAEKYMIKR